MNPKNPYENRWRWWYPAIADWMLRNPGRPMKDCAAELGKAENTIYMIAGTDMFRDYLAKRRAMYREQHDFALVSKVTQVAEASLDLILDRLDKKRDAVPMDLLDRLGYGAKPAPMVQINTSVDNRHVTVPVSLDALAEARATLRRAEAVRAVEEESRPRLPSPDFDLGAGETDEADEALHAPLTISSE
jgi:hypothetical protein